VWRTDGTAEGTRRIVGLEGAPAARAAREADPPRIAFQPLGDDVVWATYLSGGELGLIASDGERMRVLDIFGAGETTELRLWGSTGDVAYVSRNGRLYRTDGTRAGTTALEFYVGDSAFAVVGDHVAISGYSPEASSWVVYAFAPGATAPAVLGGWTGVLHAIGDRLYFGNEDGMHVWTPGGSVRTLHPDEPLETFPNSYGRYSIAESGGVVYWAAWSEADRKPRLYRSDGTTAGPVGRGRFWYPVSLTPVGGGRVVFYAGDESVPLDGSIAYSSVLWVSDGTEAGTHRLTTPLGGPTLISVTPHGAIFPGLEPDYDSELFRTDGTPAGTGKLLELNPVPYGSDPDDAVRVGDRVVFRGQEDLGLWSTDGTAEGTTRLRERDVTGEIGSDGTTAYFGARDGHVWRTDGTPAGTRSIFDGGFAPATFLPAGRVGSEFVFSARKDGRAELWRTDGTRASLLQGDNEDLGRVAATGPRALLLSTGGGLLATDGTRVTPTGQPNHVGSRDAVAVDDGFLIAGYDDEHGAELWHLDEDGRDPRLASDVNPGRYGSSPRWFARVRTGVLFLDVSGAQAVWRRADLRGTAVKPLTALQGEVTERATVVDGFAYITMANADRYRLYRTDGTDGGTTLLSEFDYGFDAPALFTGFAGTVWFTAGDGEHGVELWRTDGTAAGTRLARDIVPGDRSSVPLDLVATGDFLFFTAYHPQYGAEPWRIRRAAPVVDDPPVVVPPVTIEPLTPSPPAAAAPPVASPPSTSQGRPLTVKLTVKVKRLRTLRGRTRWRVTGTLEGASCASPVRIVLGRRDRALKRTSARLERCRLDAIVSTTSKSPGRWLQVLAPGAVSRRVPVR
jgi:ELWxxDGT repeat protein